jgi:hypothetical protein
LIRANYFYARPKETYLDRLAERRLYTHVKKLTGFGITIGGICCIISGWFIAFVKTRSDLIYARMVELGLANMFVKLPSDLIWDIIFLLGIIFIISAFVMPQLLYPFEFIWSKLSGIMGKIIFSIILTFLYFVIIFPLGVLLRSSMKDNPFYSCKTIPLPNTIEGWTKKDLDTIKSNTDNKLPNHFYFLVSILRFFIKAKRWSIIPSLLILILLGIIFFFVHGSTLAPFIYTIF